MKKIVSVLTVFLMLFTLIAPVRVQGEETVIVSADNDAIISCEDVSSGTGELSVASGSNVTVSFPQAKSDLSTYLKYKVVDGGNNYSGISSNVVDGRVVLSLNNVTGNVKLTAKYLKEGETKVEYYSQNFYLLQDGSTISTPIILKSEEIPDDYTQVSSVMKWEYEQAVEENNRNETIVSLLSSENNSFLYDFKVYDYSDGTLIELDQNKLDGHYVPNGFWFADSNGYNKLLVSLFYEQKKEGTDASLYSTDKNVRIYQGEETINAISKNAQFNVSASDTLNGQQFKYWIGASTMGDKAIFVDKSANPATVSIAEPGRYLFTPVYGPSDYMYTKLTHQRILNGTVDYTHVSDRLGGKDGVGTGIPDFIYKDGTAYVLNRIALETPAGVTVKEYSTNDLNMIASSDGVTNMFEDNTLIPYGYSELIYKTEYIKAIGVTQQIKKENIREINKPDNFNVNDIQSITPDINYKNVNSSEEQLVESKLETNSTITKYFDINMVAVDSGGVKANVTELNENVEINVTLSDAEVAKIKGNGDVSLVRIHNGEAEVLEANLDANTLTFESDAFSTYALVYKRSLNVTFGLEDGAPEPKYTLRGLGDAVSDNEIELVFNDASVSFDREADGSYTCPKGYLDNKVFIGTYDVDIKVKGSLIYTLSNVNAGSYKQNKIVANYDAVNKEIVMDFSGFGAERDEMMNLFLNADAEPEINRAVYINGTSIDNSFKKGDDSAFYKSDENTIRVKTWVLDMVKNSEKTNNSGFIAIEGYVNAGIERYTFNSNPAPEGFSTKVFQDKNNIYLDINCVTKENRDKVVLLRNMGVAFTQQYGVGVDALTIKDLQTMNAISYPDDKTLRIQLNTEGGVNGYAGYEIVLEDMFGTVVQTEAKFAIAPVVANINSSMTSLSQVTLERGWPRETFQGFEQEGHKWQWVDGSQELKTGTYKARIEVWDYKGSSYLRDANHYVDYNEACKNVDNVSYVVENGHHYLEAEIKVVKPEAVGGHETSIINFDPNNDDSYLAEANRSDVNRIDNVSSNNSLTTVDYYDIKLDGGAVTSIENEGSFTVVLPDWVDDEPVADGMEREYSVVTYHNGAAKLLPAAVNVDGTLTFKSKEFSVFTIVYKDKVKINDGGSNGNPIIIKKPVVNTSAK